MLADRRMPVVAVLVLLSLGGMVSPAASQGGLVLGLAPRVYFVAPTGSDDAPGTADEPLASIGRAAALVQPGETVVIRGGAYREQLVLTRGGTADAPITFMAYQDETPIIDGQGQEIDSGGALLTIEKEADYVSIAGLTVQNSSGAGIRNHGDYVRIAGCRVTHVDYEGIQTRGAAGVQYIGNEIWDTCRTNLGKEHEGGGPAALTARESRGIAYLGNTVHDNYGEGISARTGAEDCRIAGNTVCDNWSANICLDNSTRTLVEGNLIYMTGGRPTSPRDPATGVAVADDDSSPGGPERQPEGGGHVVRNNIILNCSRGIGFRQRVAESGLKDCTFANNTILGAWEYGIHIAGGEHARTWFLNNIVDVREDALVLEVTSPSGLDFDHNLFWCLSGESARKFGWGDRRLDFELWDAQAYEFKGNLWADPRVAEPLATTAEGAMLQAGSPAIDVGMPKGAPKLDFWGRERPVDGNRDRLKATDIGAHEFGGQ